jgi:DNA-binding MarR family transcriptional regulator
MSDAEPDFVDELGTAVLPHHLKRLCERMLDDCTEVMEEKGIDVPTRAGSMMMFLKQNGPASVVDLARALRVSHALIIRNYKPLMKGGYLLEKPDPTDGRKRLLELTEAGVDMAIRARANLDVFQRAFADLFEESGVDLYEALKSINASLDKTSLADRVRTLDS